MILAIVPAFNESKTIRAVVQGLLPMVNQVVVIDDGSHDTTATEAEAAGAKVLRHEVNRGQGAALETGHAYARQNGAQIVVHFDADGQLDPADIARGINLMHEKNADIILGSRFLEKKSNLPWFKKNIILPIGRFVDRFFGGVRLTDAHNGFRILNSRALAVVQLEQNRMAHATEIPQLIRRHKLVYAELPITVSYREFGQGVSGGLKIIRDLIMNKIV
ncbi:MAG: glycosyltransferase family 2 protein [Candidatus Magasanikbacteria bacterium]|nr:glycosyltransferase family 2 protein [Candidatus Magasanikbacteria bacterium]